MKAAVIFKLGDLPQYADFPEPIATNPDEVLMTVKAAAVKHLDRMRASGKHYSAQNEPDQPRVIGGDGVGLLADGTRVYAIGVSGMLAEKAVVERDRMVLLPAGVDDATAAALPNAVMGSAMGLHFKAKMQPGETVLINGATGVTGQIAVQLAKHYGAKRVIATGRNEQNLQLLPTLGADEIVSLKQDDGALLTQLKSIHATTPIDVIIDYVWGHSAELLLAALKGNGSFTHKTRFVSVGGMAGDTIQLSSSILRSTDLLLTGSGIGSWPKEEVQLLLTEILPEAFQMAANGQLKIDTVTMPLKDIASVWNMDIPDGKRLVVEIG